MCFLFQLHSCRAIGAAAPKSAVLHKTTHKLTHTTTHRQLYFSLYFFWIFFYYPCLFFLSKPPSPISSTPPLCLGDASGKQHVLDHQMFVREEMWFLLLIFQSFTVSQLTATLSLVRATLRRQVTLPKGLWPEGFLCPFLQHLH